MLNKKMILAFLITMPAINFTASKSSGSADLNVGSQSGDNFLLESQDSRLILLIVSGYEFYQKLGGTDVFPLYSSNLNKHVGALLDVNQNSDESAYVQAVMTEIAGLGVDNKALGSYLKKFPGKDIAEQLSRAGNIIAALTVASEVSIPGSVAGELLTKSAIRFAIANNVVTHANAGQYVDKWLAKNSHNSYVQKASSGALTDLAGLESTNADKRVSFK